MGSLYARMDVTFVSNPNITIEFNGFKDIQKPKDTNILCYKFLYNTTGKYKFDKIFYVAEILVDISQNIGYGW